MNGEISTEKKGGLIERSRSLEEGQVEYFERDDQHHSRQFLKEHVEGDIALKYVHNSHENEAVPSEVRRRIALKTNLYLFPFMGWCYALQLADRGVVSGCGVLGMMEDLNMQGSMLSWVTSSLYLGSIFGQLPAVYLMQRFGISRVSAISLFLWSVVLTVSAASQSYAGLITTRVLLGIFEATMTPAFNAITAQWVPRHAHFSRTCFWLGWEGLGPILTNSFAYGIYVYRDNISIAPWRLLLIVFGSLTLVTSIIFYFHMPDNPLEAWFLTQDEREWHVHIIQEHNSSSRYGTPVIKAYQIKEAVLDPATWLACCYALLSMIPNGASTGFANLLIEGLGFSSVGQSLLIGTTTGGVELVGCTLIGICAMFFFKNHRTVYSVFFTAATVLGLALLAWGPNKGSQFFGFLFGANFTINVGIIALLSNISSNTGGYTKMLTVDALYYIFMCVGNLCGPQSFKDSEKPSYPTGKATMAATMAASLGVMIMLLLLNVWRNWRRDRRDEKLPPEIEDPEFADLTDLENPEFRYAL